MKDFDFDAYANWLANARKEARRAQTSGDYKRLTTEYSIEDYDIREKGDHVESYNTITGETLFEARCKSEAQADLREAFKV